MRQRNKLAIILGIIVSFFSHWLLGVNSVWGGTIGPSFPDELSSMVDLTKDKLDLGGEGMTMRMIELET